MRGAGRLQLHPAHEQILFGSHLAHLGHSGGDSGGGGSGSAAACMGRGLQSPCQQKDPQHLGGHAPFVLNCWLTTELCDNHDTHAHQTLCQS